MSTDNLPFFLGYHPRFVGVVRSFKPGSGDEVGEHMTILDLWPLIHIQVKSFGVAGYIGIFVD